MKVSSARKLSRLQWGSAFTTNLPPETAFDIIGAEGQRLGYRVESRQGDDGSISIEMRLLDPLWKMLYRRLPSEVYWRVCKDGETTFIYRDTKMSCAYASTLVLSCLCCAVLLWFGVETLAFRDWLAVSALRLYVAYIGSIIALSLMFINMALVLGGSTGKLAKQFESLRREALRQGSFLTDVGRTVSLRWQLHVFSYLAFVFTTTLFALFAHPGHVDPFFSNPIGTGKYALILLVLVVLLLVLLVIVAMALRFAAFGRRLIPALGGVCLNIAMLIFLLGLLPWQVSNQRFTHELLQNVRQSAAYIHGDWKGPPLTFPNGAPASQAEVKRIYHVIRFWAWCSLSIDIFVFSVAIGFLFHALNFSLSAWANLYQMNQRPDIHWSEQTARASGFLTSFRIVLGGVWFLLAAGLVWSMTNLIGATSNLVESATRSAVPSILNGVDVSIFFTSVAFDIPAERGILAPTVLVAWTLYLVVCWGIFTVSVGSYFAQEMCVERQLRRPNIDQDQNTRKISDRVEALLRRCSGTESPPRILLIQSRFLFAQARCIGIFRARKVIEVSSRCCEALEMEELDAMLSHELAHHVMGHCRKDQILRLLGRMTFVGDGFVRVLEDTFGHELQADRVAVTQFHANPDALIKCLQKVRIITAIENFLVFSDGVGLAMDARTVETEGHLFWVAASLSWHKRLKLGLSLFLQQYLGLKHSGYWHPSMDHRIAILKELSNA